MICHNFLWRVSNATYLVPVELRTVWAAECVMLKVRVILLLRKVEPSLLLDSNCSFHSRCTDLCSNLQIRESSLTFACLSFWINTAQDPYLGSGTGSEVGKLSPAGELLSSSSPAAVPRSVLLLPYWVSSSWSRSSQPHSYPQSYVPVQRVFGAGWNLRPRVTAVIF